MPSKNKPVYMISVVAKMLDVHPQTLRLYEREGLISPSRTGGNTRLYSQEDVERVNRVLNLTREMGVNLAGVDIILRLRDQLEELETEHNKTLSEFIQFIEKKLAGSQPELRQVFENIVQQAAEEGILDTAEKKPGDDRGG